LKRAAIIIILALASLCMAAEEQAVIKIDGMSCNSCVNSVTSTLTKIDGVIAANVTLKPGQAMVTYDADKVNTAQLVNAIVPLGYKASCDNISAGEATHCVTEKAEKAEKPAPMEAKATTANKTASKAACPPTCAAQKACASSGVTVGCNPKTAAVPEKKMEAKPDHAVAMSHDDCVAVDGKACPTGTLKCKEITAFHEAMHPLHIAVDQGDYAKVRQGFAGLEARAQAVKTMKCDKTCTPDMNKFEAKRQEFLKQVDSLGQACQGNDDAMLAMEFNKMHDAYVDMAGCCK
jgi:copper chaperone